MAPKRKNDENLPDVTCKCPKCGKIYVLKAFRVFNYNPTQIYRKFCEECKHVKNQFGEMAWTEYIDPSKNNKNKKRANLGE